MTYSRDKQDIFVHKFFKEKQGGYFIDVGASFPVAGNNTYLLEQHGWVGLSFDIRDFGQQWKSRKTPFLVVDALKCDFKQIFDNYFVPNIVDYLSSDLDGNGDRFEGIVNILKSERNFKVITIEHDAYCGYEETERAKQREFLIKKGYILVCSNVMCSAGPFEDWWINPNYFKPEEYDFLICDGKYPEEIINMLTSNK